MPVSKKLLDAISTMLLADGSNWDELRDSINVAHVFPPYFPPAATKRVKVDATETVFYQFEMEVPDDVEEGSDELDELVNEHFADMTPEQREKVNTWKDDFTFTVEFPYESEVDEDEDEKNGD